MDARASRGGPGRTAASERGRRGARAPARRSRSCSTRRSPFPARSGASVSTRCSAWCRASATSPARWWRCIAMRVARKLNAPPAIQLHMLSNIALDALIGMVPILGDLFDFAFKAQTRNLALLDAYVATPHKTARRSRRGLLLIAHRHRHRVRDAHRARRLDALILFHWLGSAVHRSLIRPARSRSPASRCRCRRAPRRARSSSTRWSRCRSCRR